MTRAELHAKLAGKVYYPDFLVIGAFRYAVGRQTYVTAETSEWLIANWENLSIKARSVISRDLDEAILKDNCARELGERYLPLGMDMDRQEWLKLAQKIEASPIEQNVTGTMKS